MGSNEFRIYRMPVHALRTTLTVAILATAIGCSERAVEDAKPLATTPAPVDQTAQVDAPSPMAESVDKAAGAAALIGLTMPPYPKGLTEVQGVCVPGGEAPERVCDFGLAVLGREFAERSPANVYLVASRNADPEAQQPQWTITDALDTPAESAGRELQLGGCRLDGELRSDVVALVRHSDNEYSSDITWVRRLDTATGKFAEIELKRVDCINSGYGI